jgi:hypothetical protein
MSVGEAVLPMLPRRRRVIRAVIIMTILYVRHAIVSFFFLKPFFGLLNARPCLEYRPSELPKGPYWRLVRLKWLWNLRVWTKDNNTKRKARLDRKFLRTMESIERYAEAHFPEQTAETPLPEYDWRNGTPEDFNKRFVQTPMPVVLRGYALDCDAVKRWNFDYIVDKCGEVDVNLTSAESDRVGKLKEVRDPRMYCANADAPFKRFPELVDELGIRKLVPYLHRDNTLNQFFIGQKATGSGFHCAGIWNFFYMIEGRKKWTFVDPALTWMIYPSINISAVAFSSLVSFPDKCDLSVYKLYKYCPRYSVELNPGDVLFNPPWWWHAVDNLTLTSVAVATRWDAMRRDRSFYDLNRMLSLMALVNPQFPGFLYEYLKNSRGRGIQVLRTGGGAFDEDTKVGSENQEARQQNVYQGRVVEKIRACEKW